MQQESERDTMRPEYDFSGAVRGKHHEAYRRGTNLVTRRSGAAWTKGAWTSAC